MKEKIRKVEQFIIKHDELFFIIIFLIMISGFALNMETVVYDEMWNFQNIYKMYNGYQIYVDANVITTPLFHYIGLIFFKILGANFFVFKIYNILLCFGLFFIIYKILKKIGLNKKISLFLVLIIFVVERNIILSTANYNTLAILFVLSSIYLILNKENIKYYSFFEAIFIVLIILTKQNIGVFYIIGYILYSLIYNKNKKENIKLIFYTLLFLSIYILFMYKEGIMDGFISYCLLGIREFAENNNYSSVKDVIIMLTVVFINIYLIIYVNFLSKSRVSKEQKKYLNIFFCFGFPILMISYPIFNGFHIKIALFIQFLIFFYCIYILILEKKIKDINIITVISIFIIIMYSIFSIKDIYSYFLNISFDNYDYENVYFGTMFNEDTKSKLDKITNYINNEDKKVVVLSSEAALYMIPLKSSNGAMDLPLIGNFGKDGEKGIIDKLEHFEYNKKILLKKEKYCWQESDYIINYVKDNFTNVGEIEDFLVYEKSK